MTPTKKQTNTHLAKKSGDKEQTHPTRVAKEGSNVARKELPLPASQKLSRSESSKTHQGTQIYKDGLNLVLLITAKIKDFPKDYKYLIGDKLFNLSFDVVSLSMSAYNNEEERTTTLRLLLSAIDRIELLARVSSESKLISLENQVKILELTDSISKQAKKWLASVAKAE